MEQLAPLFKQDQKVSRGFERFDRNVHRPELAIAPEFHRLAFYQRMGLLRLADRGP